jgi:hypothetical protein
MSLKGWFLEVQGQGRIELLLLKPGEYGKISQTHFLLQPFILTFFLSTLPSFPFPNP